MANNLEVTKSVDGDEILLTFKLTDDSTLPKAVFIFENQGTTTFGSYIGVASFNELFTRQEYTGTPIPVLGNAFIRYTEGKVRLSYTQSVTDVINGVIKGLSLLNLEYLAGASVSVTTHPVP